MRRVARVLAVALGAVCVVALGQTVDFELRTFSDSPVGFAGENGRGAASGIPHRQFVTIRNESKKSVVAVILQQTVSDGAKTEIVAIERVGIAMAPGEKKRVTISVEEVRQRAAGERAALSAVAVEFMDGTLWSAPTGAGTAR
jgi:hypothetical protein